MVVFQMVDADRERNGLREASRDLKKNQSGEALNWDLSVLPHRRCPPEAPMAVLVQTVGAAAAPCGVEPRTAGQFG